MDSLFRNTLGPTAWTLVLLVPPAIFALYFLRLKRQPLEVPSTYLWTKVIEDLHVNSLWQKLRRNLLLLLQLLLALLAILALLRPGWQGEALTGKQFIFLVDRSASMSSTDAGGGTRLEAAKARVAALIDQLGSDMSAMIISFDDKPNVEQEFTGNQRLLREALARIKPSSGATNIRGAVELAAGFANPERTNVAGEGEGSATATQTPTGDNISLYILSDGRFDAVDNVTLGKLSAKYLPVGTFDATNLAITAFNTRRNENRPEERQAFVQIANFGDEPQTAEVTLLADGELIDAASVQIPAGDVGGVTFQLGDLASGALEARLAPPAAFPDALPVDNRAYAVLDRLQQARVLLVTAGNRPLELGLSTDRAKRVGKVEKMAPEAMATPEFQQVMQSETYDLVIFDGCALDKPEQMPRANTLFVGRLPPLENWRARAKGTSQGEPQIIDWQRSHPLLNLVELGNVRVAESLLVPPPAGGSMLIDSTQGPLMSIAPRDSYEDAVMGFGFFAPGDGGETEVNTDWPVRLSFPNFCLNLMQYLAGGDAGQQLHANRPGETVEIDLARRDARLAIELPDKSTRSVEPPEIGKFAFHDTDQLGVYTVRAGGELAGRFAVNLFDRQESDVRLRTRQDESGSVETVASLEIGYDDVAAESPTGPVRKELWTWLLLAALAVLVLEWYIYNRRVYV
jgi:hypothetical protein